MITIIAAASVNNVIGYKGQIPWRLPNDFKMFKEVTMGHPMIMGRKTFESLPGILPGREHLVITRDEKFNDAPRQGIFIYNSLATVLQASDCPNKDVFIIGGGEIYSQTMKYAHRILLTKVFEEFEGDAFFPVINENEFMLVRYKYHEPDDKHAHAYAFMEYKRIT